MTTHTYVTSAERIEKTYGEILYRSFQWMIGLAPEKMEEDNWWIGERHVESSVRFPTGQLVDIHFRWATEDELEEQEELEEDDVTLFNQYAAGRPVESLHIQDSENGDDVYMVATLAGGSVLQMPIGWHEDDHTDEFMKNYAE